jgi:uncharacterized protein (TIGR02001 family)
MAFSDNEIPEGGFMMRLRVYLAGLALALAAAVAHADVSVTPALVSDYDFRGYSQSGKSPALQIGLDYSSGPIHVGGWTSNIDFGPGDAKTELDLIADYSFGSDALANFNAGVIYYTYPGHDEWAYPEVWLSASKGWFSLSYYYGWAWPVVADGRNVDSQDGHYVEGSVTVPIGDSGFDVTGHVGYSFGQFWTDAEYADYSVGVSKSFGNFSAELKFVGSSQDTIKSDIFNNEDRVILSVSTTLPWAKEEEKK